MLVFEHLEGESLADRLKRESYLSLSEVAHITSDVLQGLSAAHAAHVVHRDLKPGNIFLERLPSREERSKILDFGVSKLTLRESGESTLTSFDATLGSFAYMAPEQVRGAARADERADIYSLGAVVFRALAGRLPHEGATAAILLSLKMNTPAPSLEAATGEKWPAIVERFLAKALSKAPENRFASAEEALSEWQQVLARGISMTRSPRQPVDSVPPAMNEAPTLADTQVEEGTETAAATVVQAEKQPPRSRKGTR